MAWKNRTVYFISKKISIYNRSNFFLKALGNSHVDIKYHSSSNRKKNNQENSSKFWESNFMKYFVGSTFAASFLGFYFYQYADKKKVYALEKIPVIPGVSKQGLKFYKAEEVGKHDNEKNGIWVSYKEGVYDITEFVKMHPGGSSKIMMAAGASIEPFWQIFANHNAPEIYSLLETMRIGNLDISEESEEIKSDDPYGNEPKRHKAFIINGPKPFCAEPPASLLVENFITPLDLFYVRNHLPVPDVDTSEYELEIAVEADIKKNLSFQDIKKYPRHTITSAVMCGGNRRSEMHAVKPLKGLSWSVGAVGNATWTGARLSDILNDLGINEDDWDHVQFEGMDLDPAGVPYGASIPINKALDPRADVIIAYEMNGEPIPRDHGFPIRAIVPGVVGARNVKWLAKIVVSKEESHSQFQRGDYKGFSPSVDWNTVDFSKSPSMQEMPVISAICSPAPGEVVQVKDGKFLVKGYAWSGGGRKIIRIDLTIDQGKTWHVAEKLQHDHNAKEGRHWSWSLWSTEIPINPESKEIEIWAKAVDSSYNVQPESFENIWNLRGLLCNAYHRVRVKIQK